MSAMVRWEDNKGNKFQQKFRSTMTACDCFVSNGWDEDVNTVELYYRTNAKEKWSLMHELNKQTGLDKWHDCGTILL